MSRERSPMPPAQTETVPVQILIHVATSLAEQIETGTAFFNVELITSTIPKLGVQRARVPRALDGYAHACIEEAPFCNFSVDGSKRIGALCADLAALIRAADDVPGMFNLRSWARFTIAVLATENITDDGTDTPMDAEDEAATIVAMETDLVQGRAVFEAQRARLAQTQATATAEA